MAVVTRSIIAEDDYQAILARLARRSFDLADEFAEAMRERCEALSRFPEIGHLRPDIAEGVRVTLVKPYIVIYEIKGNEVNILRIVLGSRDLRRAIDPGD